MRRFAPLILAALSLTAAAPPAEAAEARWCWVHNPGLGNIQWDCRYRTLALCAEAVGPSSDFCLENPNWPLRRYGKR